MRQLRLAKAAAQDLATALKFYKDQDPNLRKIFDLEIHRCLEKIRSSPLASARIKGEYRRFVVNKFPYSIVYKYSPGNNEIIVIAITHQRRDPMIWQKRLISNM